MTKTTDQYDPIFRHQGELLGHDWRLFKAMAEIESAFDPEAVSPCGAIGLMQIMPQTAADLGVIGTEMIRHPSTNIALGTAYFAIQYDRLAEIAWPAERILMALASYNGGRGYVNKAIRLYNADARQRFEEPYVQPQWKDIARYLADPRCVVKGKRPDHKQMTEYAEKVWQAYHRYLKEAP